MKVLFLWGGGQGVMIQTVYTLIFSEGFGYSFGVILQPLMTEFNSTKSSVSFVGSLLSGVNAMLGPILGLCDDSCEILKCCI